LVTSNRLKVVPVTAEHWDDLARLFGERGACGGCWCMAFRRSRKDYYANKGEGNRKALRQLVRSGAPVGVLAYIGDEPVGWCAVAPKSEYVVLLKSRNLSALQGPHVWSVTCFFILKEHRGRGVGLALLEGAVKLARKHGAQIIEGYPHEPREKLPPPFIWTGIASVFRRAGFKEVERRSKQRPLMQLQFENPPRSHGGTKLHKNKT
jgi:GNAT superfamily N-acetyltransferase